MRFIWDAINVPHVARHELTPDQVDAVLDAVDLGFQVLPHGRIMIEGTAPVGSLRVVAVAVANEVGNLYVITAYRMHPKRRRTTL